MISSPELAKLFNNSYHDVRRAVRDLSHEESLSLLMAGVNPAHWILGHIVVARCNILALLGEAPIWPWSICERFISGSHPVTDPAEALEFATLLRDLDRSQAALEQALAVAGPENLAEVKGEAAVGEHLLTYAVHEAFHAGQLSILREALRG